eukprot:scaffold1942_cov197-Alexandrium_tamarense.AAC.24
MGVSDELAALRAKGTVKKNAADISSKSPRNLTLSTPEAEEAALRAKKERDKAKKVSAYGVGRYMWLGTYDELIVVLVFMAEAQEGLRKNTGAASAELEHSLSQRGKKKEDLEKKNEAKIILSKGASGGGIGVGNTKPAVAATKKESVPVVVADAKAAVAAKPAKETSAPNSEPDKKDATTPAAQNPATKPAKEATNPITAQDANDDDNDDDDDDDVPELEEADTTIPNLEQAAQFASQEGEAAEQRRQTTNRNEKKVRKMMSRLNLRPVPGIARVTLKTGGRGYFAIDRPDVFASSCGGKNDTYVIFGEARQGGGFGGGAQSAQAQAFMAQQQAAMTSAAAAKANNKNMASVAEEEELGGQGEETVDESGVETKDIELVMSQATCSRAKAVQALKENDGDLVNAIMSLTT